MKKKLVVAAINQAIIDTYTEQLKELLGNCVEIDGYQMGVDKGELKGDLVVVSMQSTVPIARSYMKDHDTPVVWIYTTFLKSSIEQLQEIPPGSRMLLLTKFWYYGVESINLLKEMGVDHIDLIPYFPEIEDSEFDNIHGAVAMGYQGVKVPDGISEQIDIGWRVINPTCFEKIIDALGLESEKGLSERLDQYRQSVVMIDTDRFMRAGYLPETTSKIIDVLNALDQGILIIDPQDGIMAYNQSLCNMLGIEMKKYLGTPVESVSALRPLVEHARKNMLSQSVYFDTTVNKKFTVSRRDMIFQYQKYNDVIILDEIQANGRKAESLPQQLSAKYTFDSIVGSSHRIQKAIEEAKKFAQIDAPVLIVGETGTGKELFAHSIHNHSVRSAHPFIAVNCASMPTQLLESELFGYEGGSFTGALKKGKPGIFEIADGGTVFLDEIGDADPDFQVRLLRVLQEHEIIRIGGTSRKQVNVRVIAATHQNLVQLKSEGKFRKDLYYRLCAMVLNLPGLSERQEDIPILARYFINKVGGERIVFEDELVKFLESHTWEGNIRELKNCVEYLGYFGGTKVGVADLPVAYQEESKRILQRIECDTLLLEIEPVEKEKLRMLLTFLSNGTGGRYKLHSKMKEQGMEISEYDIRKMLINLGQHGLVKNNLGRQGSQITEIGRNLLEYLNERDK